MGCELGAVFEFHSLVARAAWQWGQKPARPARYTPLQFISLNKREHHSAALLGYYTFTLCDSEALQCVPSAMVLSFMLSSRSLHAARLGRMIP